MSIRHLTYQQINFAKWDDCIQQSHNRLIYAESVYLNNMSPNWEALVSDDYHAVMPLCWKKKWGIRYLYQPAFIQQTGIFSQSVIDRKLTESFIQAASERFRFAETTLNYANPVESAGSDYHVETRNNFILPLNSTFTQQEYPFNNYIRQRVNRAIKNNLVYQSSTDYKQAIRLYRKYYQERLPAFSSEMYQRFENLCDIYNSEQRVIIREVCIKTQSDPLAVVLLLSDGKRLYNMASSISSEGRKLLANYYLFSELIKEFSGSGLLLDFEGSDVPGIAFFYEKLASANQPYPFIRFNHLPAVIRWLKN